VHSSRGGQYYGKTYRKYSMTTRPRARRTALGDCYDNTQAKSLWSRLKTAVLEGRELLVFADLTDAQGRAASPIILTIVSINHS
jgi:putative transposase